MSCWTSPCPAGVLPCNAIHLGEWPGRTLGLQLTPPRLHRRNQRLTRVLYGVWCIPSMKVTFELPPPLVQQLRSHVPSGERSRFVANLISKKLQTKGNALAQAAQKAN